MEDWLIGAAREVRLKPQDYRLPGTSKELKDITQRASLESNKNFNGFVDALVERRPPRIVLLQQWLAEFIEGAEIGRF